MKLFNTFNTDRSERIVSKKDLIAALKSQLEKENKELTQLENEQQAELTATQATQSALTQLENAINAVNAVFGIDGLNEIRERVNVLLSTAEVLEGSEPEQTTEPESTEQPKTIIVTPISSEVSTEEIQPIDSDNVSSDTSESTDDNEPIAIFDGKEELRTLVKGLKRNLRTVAKKLEIDTDGRPAKFVRADVMSRVEEIVDKEELNKLYDIIAGN